MNRQEFHSILHCGVCLACRQDKAHRLLNELASRNAGLAVGNPQQVGSGHRGVTSVGPKRWGGRSHSLWAEGSGWGSE